MSDRFVEDASMSEMRTALAPNETMCGDVKLRYLQDGRIEEHAPSGHVNTLTPKWLNGEREQLLADIERAKRRLVEFDAMCASPRPRIL